MSLGGSEESDGVCHERGLGVDSKKTRLSLGKMLRKRASNSKIQASKTGTEQA